MVQGVGFHLQGIAFACLYLVGYIHLKGCERPNVSSDQLPIEQNIRTVINCTENELGHLTGRFGGNLNRAAVNDVILHVRGFRNPRRLPIRIPSPKWHLDCPTWLPIHTQLPLGFRSQILAHQRIAPRASHPGQYCQQHEP